MKQVKIFLASSIVEFEHERNELISYIHRLNEQYVKRGVFFDLVICENASNAMAATRKQDEYNEAIRSSQYVYVLVGDRMGAYTEEEIGVHTWTTNPAHRKAFDRCRFVEDGSIKEDREAGVDSIYYWKLLG